MEVCGFSGSMSNFLRALQGCLWTYRQLNCSWFQKGNDIVLLPAKQGKSQDYGLWKDRSHWFLQLDLLWHWERHWVLLHNKPKLEKVLAQLLNEKIRSEGHKTRLTAFQICSIKRIKVLKRVLRRSKGIQLSVKLIDEILQLILSTKYISNFNHL